MLKNLSMYKKQIALGIGGVIIAVGGISACGASQGTFDKITETFKDAPIGDRVNQKVDIIEMPDGYANVATTCYKGMRYSTTTTGGGQSEARAVSVTADPSCAVGAK